MLQKNPKNTREKVQGIFQRPLMSYPCCVFPFICVHRAGFLPERRGDEEKGRKGEAGETVEVKKGRKVAFYYW